MLYDFVCTFASFCIVMFLCGYFFFFFKQKTAYEMRISDWSSDVCSSDLIKIFATWFESDLEDEIFTAFPPPDFIASPANRQAKSTRKGLELSEIGRASCRERVCQYV